MSLAASVKIVLVGTSHPGNIGSAARAMKTMLLDELVLVAPVEAPNAQATAMAAGADDVLYRAQTVATLAEAIADCQWVIGATARPRGMTMPEDGPRDGIAQAMSQVEQGRKIALIFGRERTGLTNAEVEHCNRLIRIPSNPDYSSLNLSQAVQVLCYELRMQQLDQLDQQADRQDMTPAKSEQHSDHLPANQAQLASLFDHWYEVFLDQGFLNDDNAVRLMRFVRVMMTRSQPTLQEVNVLRGMLSSIAPYRGAHFDSAEVPGE